MSPDILPNPSKDVSKAKDLPKSALKKDIAISKTENHSESSKRKIEKDKLKPNESDQYEIRTLSRQLTGTDKQSMLSNIKKEVVPEKNLQGGKAFPSIDKLLEEGKEELPRGIH